MRYSIGKASCLVFVLALSVLAGCRSATQPQTTVRSAAQTAPTDLQLTCASEAATRLGIQNALPVSSTQTQPDTYRVDLRAGDASAVCMIRSDGTVVSVDRG